MFLVEVLFKYGDETKARHLCKSGTPIEAIMKDFYESYLKDEYRNWIEASTYLKVEGIKRKKSGQLLNTVEKYEPILSDDWVTHCFDYKKLQVTFAIRPSQTFMRRITCNL